MFEAPSHSVMPPSQSSSGSDTDDDVGLAALKKQLVERHQSEKEELKRKEQERKEKEEQERKEKEELKRKEQVAIEPEAPVEAQTVVGADAPVETEAESAEENEMWDMPDNSNTTTLYVVVEGDVRNQTKMKVLKRGKFKNALKQFCDTANFTMQDFERVGDRFGAESKFLHKDKLESTVESLNMLDGTLDVTLTDEARRKMSESLAERDSKQDDLAAKRRAYAIAMFGPATESRVSQGDGSSGGKIKLTTGFGFRTPSGEISLTTADSGSSGSGNSGVGSTITMTAGRSTASNGGSVNALPSATADATNEPSATADATNEPSAMADATNEPSAMEDATNEPSAMEDATNEQVDTNDAMEAAKDEQTGANDSAGTATAAADDAEVCDGTEVGAGSSLAPPVEIDSENSPAPQSETGADDAPPPPTEASTDFVPPSEDPPSGHIMGTVGSGDTNDGGDIAFTAGETTADSRRDTGDTELTILNSDYATTLSNAFRNGTLRVVTEGCDGFVLVHGKEEDFGTYAPAPPPLVATAPHTPRGSHGTSPTWRLG